MDLLEEVVPAIRGEDQLMVMWAGSLAPESIVADEEPSGESNKGGIGSVRQTSRATRSHEESLDLSKPFVLR